MVLDPRQERDYDRGLKFFLENVSVKKVFPMHYWEKPEIIDVFLKDYPQYENQIKKPE